MSGSGATPGSSGFLELLAREAPAAEFEQPVAAARAAGAPDAQVAALERDRRLALSVRSLLEHRRRREAELSGLFDTAGDLAGLRDLDAVLRAIVHRARTLLGADLAYLTLHDPERGDTYMRVTDGSVSATFQALRLPMGAGLGGLVAQTATPYVTADYLSDERFAHLDAIDTGVSEEGLVAILGVPLLLGEAVLGVLFAANRSARPFTREEVALLASLGAHAAVAIDSARRLSETRAALAELSAANETIRAHSAAVERAAAAHDRLAALVLQGGGVEEVATTVAEVLGGALLVLDAAGRTLASVGALTPPRPTEVAEALAASRATGRSGPRAVWSPDRWYAPVVAGAEDLGLLVWRPEPAGGSPAGEPAGEPAGGSPAGEPAGEPAGAADQRILERAAVVTALLLLFRRTVAEAEARVRGELLDDLIARPVRDLDALRARAARLGVDLETPFVLVVATYHPATGDGLRHRAGFWAGSYATGQGGLAATRSDRVVLMLPGSDPAAAARAVAGELGQVLDRPVTAGAAGPANGPAGLADAAREADRCAAALVALGRGGQGAGAAELGFVGMLLGAAGGTVPAVGGFVSSVLGPVLDYDTRRGTALTTTLEAYFATGGSLSRAAQRLHVHVNTVTQRLERVSRLLGPQWQQPERALEIQLALRLHRLAAVGPPDAAPPGPGPAS